MPLDAQIELGTVREQLLETEAIEVPGDESEDGAEEATARPLPAKLEDGSALAVWSGEVKTAALAAAGGVLAGAATVAVVRATRAVAGPKTRSRMLRGRDRPQNVVASRSFIVDVHLLGQK